MKLHSRLNFLQIVLMGISMTIASQFHVSARSSDLQDKADSKPLDSASTTSSKYVDQSLWPYLNPDSSLFPSEMDSMKAAAIYRELIPDLSAYNRISSNLRNRKISSEVANTRLQPIIQRLWPKMEEIIRLNPFHKSAKTWLGMVIYPSLERQFLAQEEWKNYIRIASNLIQIHPENYHYNYYGKIANAYFQLDEVQEVLVNYRKGITSLFDTYEDSIYANQERYIAVLRFYMTRRWQIEESLSLIDAAIISLKNLLVIAPDDQKQILQRRLERLQWDDRNLNATRKKEKANQLWNDAKYEQTHAILENLLDSLRTEAAKDEINWLLARIEYNNLKQRYQALNRLWQVIKKTPLDSMGMPVDSTYQRYITTYADLCIRQGVAELNLEHRRAAYIYFSRASEIEGRHQARCYYYLARLISLDPRSVKHTQRTIEYGQKAWDLRENLNDGERKYLARLISLAYQQSGEFDVALEWYKIYYQL